MEATVKRFASLLAALLTFLMINPSSANAAAPDQELLHNGHVDAALTEGDQATDRPTTQVLGDSTDLNDRDSTDISPSPDADDSIVLDHGHADIFRVGRPPMAVSTLSSKRTSPVTGYSTPPRTSFSTSKIPLSPISRPPFLAPLRDMSCR